jgi:Flp pilus assembly protein TadG
MTRLRRDDRGQITTALVMVGIVLLVALGLLVTKLGQATDQKSKVQIAADAAALAGAQQIRKEVPELVRAAIRGRVADPFGNMGDMGHAQAENFAGRAGAAVKTYSYDPDSDTVQVSVESSSASVSGEPAKAEAQARVGKTLGRCNVLPTLAPTPTTSTPPASTTTTTSTPTTSTPANLNVTVDCGGLSLDVVLDDTGLITLPNFSDIFDKFEPALKS